MKGIRGRRRAPEGGGLGINAYILVQVEVGTGADVGEEIAKIPGVLSTAVVTGPYDLVVLGEAGSIDELGRLVVSRIQAVDGVTRTMTCPVLHF